MVQSSQAALQLRLGVFTKNGKLPPAQEVLATIGYTPPVLEAEQLVVQEWLGHGASTQALRADQKQATQIEKTTLRAAKVELNILYQTIRLSFVAEPNVLTTIGLAPRHHNTKAVEAAPAASDVEPNTSPEVHRHPHTPNIADMVAQWRLSLTNVQTLSAAQQAVLVSFGWSPERLAAAAALVEACAAAHATQKQTIQEYQAESAAAHALELELRQWDKQFTRLARLAIKQADPENRLQLLELLGL